VRISAGRGFRPANIFTDNFGIYVSQRNLLIQRDLYLPEVSWNSGISFTQNFLVGGKEASVSAEYFYTFFENQIIFDRETPGVLSIYNLNGNSYAHVLQVEASYEPFTGLEIRAASKLQEVRAHISGEERQVPLVPVWRGMTTVGYETANRKWQADITAQFTGLSRIPSTSSNLPENKRLVLSDPYFLLNSQITRRFKRIELYMGVENLANYKQPNAIISADSPFSSEFDASLMWAPVNGRVIYGGLRLKF
jgi:outer membrane receptor protein involved in Fe transport